ncbi:MAG: ATP-binding protein [Thaumarchaeota archaeon]|nr:MAG: ATP-binding protein [Nitrososphaerota archaeon]
MSKDSMMTIDELKAAIEARMKSIRRKVLILSGKGGVGKSIVTANLAVALAKKIGEGKIGILDGDLTGPSIPKILKARGQQLSAGPPGIFPARGPLGIKIVSMDYLLPSDETPVIWRGPMKARAIMDFLSQVVWGRLDYLLVDLPPGTGDEALTIAQSIPRIDGVIIVTIPSELSKLIVAKAISFCRRLELPILGVIENMSWFTCPSCGARVEIFTGGGGEKLAREMGLKLLGRIPLDPNIAKASDLGEPYIISYPDSPGAQEFLKIAEEIEETLA